MKTFDGLAYDETQYNATSGYTYKLIPVADYTGAIATAKPNAVPLTINAKNYQRVKESGTWDALFVSHETLNHNDILALLYTHVWTEEI